MALTVKLTEFGDSIAIVLPDELLQKLRWSDGDTLHVVDTYKGIELTTDAEFARQMEVANRVMDRNRDLLRKLAD